MPTQRAGAGALTPAGSEECTQVGRAEGVDVCNPRWTAEMAGQETQELAGVACVGFKRVVGKTPLPCQIFQPFHAMLEEVWGCDR